ncbi:MAG: permease, partial [Geminicoccaceae bacterium]|nr:permease [Geminicoccaceae bacterium]
MLSATDAVLRVCRALLVALSSLVPGDRRREWRDEWNGELWELMRRAERAPRRYGSPRRAAVRFTIGALSHAIYEWGQGWTMDLLLRDVQHAVRSVIRNRGFALTAILLIAVGVGANTTVFTIVEAVLFRPPAGVVDPERIVQLGRGTSPNDFDNWSHPRYVAFRDGTRRFAELAAWTSGEAVIGSGDETELASAQVVSASYFGMLGARPALGRWFMDVEEREVGGHPVAVLSDQLWRTRYAATRDVIGKTLVVRGEPFTIVGVAPRGFVGADIGSSRPDFWVPLSMHASIFGGGTQRLNDARLSWLWIAGRLAPGVGMLQASAAVRSIMSELERDTPEDRRDGVQLVAGLGLRPEERAMARRILAVLMGIVGGLLLIASANLVGLLVARGAARRGEMAVRLAIGASRGRLVRQLVLETVAIATLGSVAAFVLTFWTARLVTPLIPYDVAVSYTPDLRVLIFAIVVGVGTSVIFGLVPAWRSARTDLVTVMRNETPGIVGHRGRLLRVLAVGQFALSFILLANTGLLVRSVQRMNATDPGFRTEDVLVGELELSGVTSSPPARPRLTEVMERLASLPGVVGVARASAVPASGPMASRSMWRVDGFDAGALPPNVRYMTVDTAYLALMGVRILRGRGFTSADTSTATPVMIINETMARRLWPDGDALGNAVAYGTLEGLRTARVVGIAADTRNRSLREPPGLQAYVPVSQEARGRILLHVRTSTPTPAFASSLAAEIRRAVPAVPSVTFETVR